MPRSSRLIHISVIAVTGLATLTVGCTAAVDAPTARTTPPSSPSTSVSISPEPSTARIPPAANTQLPQDVEQTARAFTRAYAEHDARDGKDRAYADAGARAAKLATGALAPTLAEVRPVQAAPWAALRAEKAHQRTSVNSVAVPDGAPSATKTSALVRVGYTLTTIPKSGPKRQSEEHLALQLERTAEGWRVVALPWA